MTIKRKITCSCDPRCEEQLDLEYSKEHKLLSLTITNPNDKDHKYATVILDNIYDLYEFLEDILY